MGSRQDDEEWVDGVPPEGRHGAERADPGYWRRQWKAQAIVFGILFLLVVVVLILALV